MDTYEQENLAHWDELAVIHARGDLYGLAEFRAGKTKLNALDLAEVGEVAGKSLLHLQCHFGLDTLSWARLGATVTGADFSGQAIGIARNLADELHIAARFVQSTIDALPDNLDAAGQFDVVYTGRGALCWLRDIDRWAQVVAHFLKAGGVLYVADTHPAFCMYEEQPGGEALQLLYSYFQRAAPERFVAEASYMDANAKLQHTTEYVWNHPLSDIINALIAAGLRIEFLHEFPYTFHNYFPRMLQGDDGFWRLPDPEGEKLPLMFSLRATRTA